MAILEATNLAKRPAHSLMLIFFAVNVKMKLELKLKLKVLVFDEILQRCKRAKKMKPFLGGGDKISSGRW